MTTQNVYRHKWIDKSPITFTQWELNMPSTDTDKACTRLNLENTGTNKWESISCFKHAADRGVCERPLGNVETEATVVKNTADKDSLTVSYVRTEDLSVYFRCQDGETISTLGRCDGVIDCFHADDEKGCENDITSCKMEEFRCSDGNCVSVSVLCDYHIDCVDGSDENCDFVPCGLQEFRCRNYECIDQLKRCDSQLDCLDGSDETDCDAMYCNTLVMFACDSKCIANSFVCDGHKDCVDGMDEKGCALPVSCEEWWMAGYHENGLYGSDGVGMDCEFTNGTITTRYHAIDYERYIGSNFGEARLEAPYNKIVYRNGELLRSIVTKTSGTQCYQSIDQLCHPLRQLLMTLDVHPNDQICQICSCRRYIKQLSGDVRITVCEDSPQGILYNDKGMVLNGVEPDIEMEFDDDYGYITSFRIKSPQYFLDNQLRLKFNPIECVAEFKPAVPKLSCGHGISTSAERRCLYDQDVFRTMIGCRSLEHLQGCGSFQCPKEYFKCEQSFCLEKRFVCDGEIHCEHGEDERNCEERICESQYRCLNSSICLNQRHLCDGFRHCPNGDDERQCNFRCPDFCACFGLIVDCSQADLADYQEIIPSTNSSAVLSSTIRRLDISSNAKLFQFFQLNQQTLNYLIHLNISFCEIENISVSYFQYMPNLKVLDLSFNKLTWLAPWTFRNQKLLQSLYLDGNINILTLEPEAFLGLVSVRNLVMSKLNIRRLSKNAFVSMELETFALYDSIVDVIEDDAFAGLHVRNIFLNTSRIHDFSSGMFQGIENIQLLITDSYKFCCVRPVSLSSQNCYPQEDELSSCSDLMRHEVLRTLVWLVGLFILLSNASSLIYRIIYDQARLKLGYGIFVSNLAVSDSLMGVFLIIIASADASLRGMYIFKEEAWRLSSWCVFAGFCASLSTEVTVFFICLISLDRYLVIKYPFGQIRISQTIGNILASVAWLLGVIIAAFPLIITPYFKGEFYSKNGICLALPLTRNRPPGWAYSFFIFIVLNSVIFVLIAACQWFIYIEIKASRKTLAGQHSSRSTDLKVTRNLLLVVTTNFLCWFPIGTLGVLALIGNRISADVYAWTAVIVLPINSALNPCLYTLSTIKWNQDVNVTETDKKQDNLFSQGKIENVLQMWTTQCFLTKTTRVHKLLPLEDVLKTERLTFYHCLKTAVVILKCLKELHEKDLIQESFDERDIQIIVVNPKTVRVFMNCHPKLMEKKTQKAANTEAFGNIMSRMIERYEAIRSRADIAN